MDGWLLPPDPAGAVAHAAHASTIPPGRLDGDAGGSPHARRDDRRGQVHPGRRKDVSTRRRRGGGAGARARSRPREARRHRGGLTSPDRPVDVSVSGRSITPLRVDAHSASSTSESLGGLRMSQD